MKTEYKTIKGFLLVVPKVHEYVAFTDRNKALEYARYWHLSQDETDILDAHDNYMHDNLGLIELYPQFINPQFGA